VFTVSSQARSAREPLTGLVVGWCPQLAQIRPSSIAALVRLPGVPEVTAGLHPAHPGGLDPTLLRLHGPITWEILFPPH
jgi:hypothetical protein